MTSVPRPKRFDPNTDQHLEWALKTAYRHLVGDMDISTPDAREAVVDALCNLIGDDAFCEFVES